MLGEKVYETPNSCPHGRTESQASKVLASGVRFKEVSKKSALKLHCFNVIYFYLFIVIGRRRSLAISKVSKEILTQIN